MMNNKAISAPCLLQTGQCSCHNPDGRVIPCQDTGQDAESRAGQAWPEPRFERHMHGVLDRLTNLLWRHTAELAAGPVTWNEALAMISKLNADETSTRWRLPNINELESLVDCASHQPALPAHHPFVEVQDIY